MKNLVIITLCTLLFCYGNGSEIGNAAVVVGKLIDEFGNPAPGVEVNLFKKTYIPKDSIATDSFYYTDSDGWYSIPFTDTGIYNLIGESDSGYVCIADIDANEIKSIEIHTDTIMAPGSIAGSVSRSGQSDKIQIFISGTKYSAFINPDGTFFFPKIPKGSFNIVIFNDSIDSMLPSITVKPAVTTTVEEIVLSDSMIIHSVDSGVLIEDFDSTQITLAIREWYYTDDYYDNGNSSVLAQRDGNGFYQFKPAEIMGYQNTKGGLIEYQLGNTRPVGCNGNCEYAQRVSIGVEFPDTLDISNYDQINFRAKASVPMKVTFQVKTLTISDSGWYCITKQISTTWEQYTLPFTNMIQPNWAVEEDLDLRMVKAFEWVITADNTNTPQSGSFIVDNIYVQ